MLMHPALEGFKWCHQHNLIWKAVPYLDCCVDECLVNGNRSVHWYCKSMRWHWHAGVGGSCDNIRPSKQSTMVCRAFTGVHFVEESNCCHLTSLVERWDVQFYPSLICIHTNNSKWHLPDRVQQSKLALIHDRDVYSITLLTWAL